MRYFLRQVAYEVMQLLKIEAPPELWWCQPDEAQIIASPEGVRQVLDTELDHKYQEESETYTALLEKTGWSLRSDRPPVPTLRDGLVTKRLHPQLIRGRYFCLIQYNKAEKKTSLVLLNAKEAFRQVREKREIIARWTREKLAQAGLIDPPRLKLKRRAI